MGAAQGWVRSATNSTRSPRSGAGTAPSAGPSVGAGPSATVLVQGPSRPVNGSGQAGSASGISGSASGTFSCTGPGGPPRPRPPPTRPARPSTASAPAAPDGSGEPRTRGRTAARNRRCRAGRRSDWPQRPAARADGPRTDTISGTWPCAASSTAGCRLATAVPEVVITAAGCPDPRASPRARKPAVRSSIRTCRRSRPVASASCSANDRGALRDPGARMASVRPQATSSSTRTRATAVDEFTAGPPHRTVCTTQRAIVADGQGRRTPRAPAQRIRASRTGPGSGWRRDRSRAAEPIGHWA